MIVVQVGRDRSECQGWLSQAKLRKDIFTKRRQNKWMRKKSKQK